MPIIAKFYGIIIKMYFIQSEHNPPHLHAFYENYVAAIQLDNLRVMSGYLPPKAMSLVLEWMKIHQQELITMWDEQRFTKIEGLE